MIAVLETSPGVFTTSIPDPLERLSDGARSPLAVVLSLPEEDRAAYSVCMAEPAVVPEGHRVVSSDYERVDGVVRQTVVTEAHNPVPSFVSPRQMRLALIAYALDDDVDAYVATLPKEAQVEWEYATEVRRDNQLINAAASALGMNQAQADDLFRLAASL
jgi:hypothetical protein